MQRFACLLFCLAAWLLGPVALAADQAAPPKPVSGSMIEDRAASKLFEAGQARYEAEEPAKAVEIWQSIIERYPRSRVRFAAHMALGKHYLDRERAYDRARVQFELGAVEDNRDQEQRAEAMMRTGACYYHLRNYGKCFQIMRDVIDTFPASPVVNDAWYYIGLGHFQLGHYSRAIAALENVGTAMSGEKGKAEKVEAGKRLFVRIEDADLAVLDPQQPIDVQCAASSGDRETIKCFLIARNTRLAIGSIPTRLGKPVPGNGQLEVQGDDNVKIGYIDQHTAEKELNRKVERTVDVVGTASVQITDGAYSEPLLGVVLGKDLNLQINDADRDLTDRADTVKATVFIYRVKTEEEIEAAAISAHADASKPAPKTAEGIRGKKPDATTGADPSEGERNRDTLKEIERRDVVLTEVRLPRKIEKGIEDIKPAASQAVPEKDAKPAGDAKGEPKSDPLALSAASPKIEVPPGPAQRKPEAKEAPVAKETPPAKEPSKEVSNEVAKKPELAKAEADDSFHSGVFRISIPLEKSETVVRGDDNLQAMPGDIIRVIYLDGRHRGDGTREVVAQAKCLEGNIGAVRVSHAMISDQELRIQTQLKTAMALTSIGNRYKEFGLKKNADDKYKQALAVCEEILGDAAKLGGRVLEETYVQLWRIYFEMERLDLAAAMCQRLQQQFPASGFVDEALLQLAEVARKQNDLNRAIHTFSSLLTIRTSPLRGEAQFGIGQCYDQMAKAAEGEKVASLRARAFAEYKKVFDQFPESGRVGDAVAKMADYYYEQKDYSRAIEVFETVIANHPDAKFLDVILFNYGRCLYRMDRKPQAIAKFEQLLAEFPDSPLAGDAKKIVDAVRKAGK